MDSTQIHHGYKVGVPPKKNVLTEFSDAIKETFFPDDPLRQYRDQPRSKKIWLGLQQVFPVLEWGRGYNLGKFKGDLISGLTIASLCIPQDIAYAKLAGLPPQYGLYSSFVPPLIYALMGSSRDIAIGPVAVVSLLLGTLLDAEIDSVKNPEEYRRLAFTATFFAGVTEAALGFFRQLMLPLFTQWNWQTILIGASFLTFLLVAKYIGKKNRKLFWVAAIAPLTSVIISTFFVYITRADKQGVAIVKKLHKGVNPPSASLIYFSGPNLAKGFRIGVIAGMIALTEAIAIGRTFAAMKDYQIDGNKEMVALGTMNIVGSMTSCYIATGSFSRSAVNYMAGCQTAISNVVMSIVVIISLAKILLQVTRPRTAILGNLPRTTIYRNVEQYPDATKVPGVLIVRVDSAIYFTNSNYIKERILRWLRDEEEELMDQKLPKIDFLIVDLSPVIDIDTSGIHALEELLKALEKRKVQLVLANPGTTVIQKLRAARFTDLIGEDKIFLTVGDAVKKFAPKAVDNV
ncbi:hypothetical protein PR202_ga26742 [Eleusine coracana subsp. coracana]|uniref:STAS domain-containing protein n=1 Tax=Eleusine coracana subsp. coracana TaxID=191504 RepID=A0AAV5DEW7_ELECO|nr:hypothetical protein PR202_ga26742 [Eleusine coracana subsp. coracana]